MQVCQWDGSQKVNSTGLIHLPLESALHNQGLQLLGSCSLRQAGASACPAPFKGPALERQVSSSRDVLVAWCLFETAASSSPVYLPPSQHSLLQTQGPVQRLLSGHWISLWFLLAKFLGQGKTIKCQIARAEHPSCWLLQPQLCQRTLNKLVFRGDARVDSSVVCSVC